MKIKSVNRALVVENRNREVAGGSLWAGRLLRQALSFYGGVSMGEVISIEERRERKARLDKINRIVKPKYRKLYELVKKWYKVKYLESLQKQQMKSETGDPDRLPVG